MSTITDTHLLLERQAHMGGVQRVYRFNNGYGLSAINSPMAHIYPFAWEIAVLKGVSENGSFETLCYDTPLTSDVEVFQTTDEANAFIERAAREIGGAS